MASYGWMDGANSGLPPTGKNVVLNICYDKEVKERLYLLLVFLFGMELANTLINILYISYIHLIFIFVFQGSHAGEALWKTACSYTVNIVVHL